jgi:hypothetical protein
VATIEELDDSVPSIPSKLWQGICMGFRENGEPFGSPNTWAKRRAAVLGKQKRNGCGPRNLTKREAFLLLVRSKIDKVCDDIGHDRISPRVVNRLDAFDLEALGNKWLIAIGGDEWTIAINALTSNDMIPADALAEIIRKFAGKSWGERTIRRKCGKARIRFSKKRMYSPAQVQRILKVCL